MCSKEKKESREEREKEGEETTAQNGRELTEREMVVDRVSR